MSGRHDTPTLIDGALDLASYVLRADPSQLVGQLVGRLEEPVNSLAIFDEIVAAGTDHGRVHFLQTPHWPR